MPDKKTNYYDTSKVETIHVGQSVDEMMQASKNGRFMFERHWYDNNWFDDGHHFRFLSRQQNKIIDLTERANMYAPLRTIPKASKQIRGMVNLLTSSDLVPIVYPEKVEMANFSDQMQFKQAKQISKVIAKRIGHWIEEEFKEQDMVNKLSQMILLAAKHGISYLQVTPDAEKEAIVTNVRDAFDVYVVGDQTELTDSPYVIIAHPKIIAEIKANESFDEVQRMMINPDNKLASSEIKEAYMRAKYGRQFKTDSSATIILKEAYIKEHLCKNNMERIRKQKNGGDILKDRKEGDVVIRQVYVAGNIWLRDEYIELPEYPVVAFRFEPGPLYQVPIIERFIQANKSLDQVVSRIERFTHTMGVGVWTKRAGEQFNLSNQAGGQIIEYKSTPPTQANLAPMPAYIFNFVELLTSFIEEQGLTTTTLGKIPRGVESAKAIESLKETEYANLVVATRMLKRSVKLIAEKFIDLADRYFVTPQTVQLLDQGEPDYFDIMSKSAMMKRAELGVPVEKPVIPLSKECLVDIEVQNGMAYTREGKKAAAKELGDYMMKLVQVGALPPEAINKFLQTFLEAFEFGPTSEFMEIMNNSGQQGNLSQQQLDAIKVAVAQVLKDLSGSDVLPNQQQRVDESKMGAAQALVDTGSVNKAQPAAQAKPPSVSIGFKDLPPSGQLQAAAEAGIQLDPQEVMTLAAIDATKKITSDKGQQLGGVKQNG